MTSSLTGPCVLAAAALWAASASAGQPAPAALPPSQPAPASGAPAAAAPQAARPYVDGFCLRIATGAGQGPGFYRLIASWGARAMNDTAGGAAAPVDEPVQGQGFRFEAAPANAPVAFLEPRRGMCALVYAGPELAPDARAEISEDRPTSGPDGAEERWRKVTPAFVGRPRPPRWFLQVGAKPGEGVCADALTDLRRRDGAVVSMLRLSPCSPDAAEKVETS